MDQSEEFHEDVGVGKVGWGKSLFLEIVWIEGWGREIEEKRSFFVYILSRAWCLGNA